MSKPAVENTMASNFNQMDDSIISLQENSHQLFRTSNLKHDFNIELNKAYNLNEHNELTGTSDGIKTPFNKFMFDYENPEKNTTRKLSEIENLDHLESDESLGILPDLLNDEATFDVFRTDLDFSEGDINDGISLETNKSPAPLVFSPPVDNQFNRISLYLKNISTPLPNFGNERRCSSTPKISVTSQFVANTTDSIEDNSSLHLSDEKDEAIIAGSCRIKFETDFNLDDLKNVKPLTSTNKAFSPPRLSLILNELNEETGLKSEVSFQKQSETIENNLNVVQTLSDNVVEELLPCEYEKNIQNLKVLNDTFQVKQSVLIDSVDAFLSPKDCTRNTLEVGLAKSNNYEAKGNVKTLDSTFAIPADKFNCKVDCEKTFVIDFNSTIGTEVSPKSIYTDRILNETHVLGMDYMEFSSKKQDQIANVTFTKDLDDTKSNIENHCYSFHGATFKPLNPILEETFSKSDLSEMKDLSKNVSQCINRNQLTSPDTFNMKGDATYSENVDKFLLEMNGTRNISSNRSYQIEIASPNSPKSPRSNIYEQEGENISHEQINLTENENNPSNKILLSAALESIIPKEDCSFEILTKSSNPCINTTFTEKADGAQNDINLISIENNRVQASQNSLKEISNATFSEEICEAQIKLNSIPTEKDNYQASPKEKTYDIFSELADKNANVQHKKQLSQCDRDSFGGITSSNLKKIDSNNTVSKKDTDKSNSLKNCSMESKTIRKSRLIKPTKTTFSRKVPEQLNNHLSVPKSLNESLNDKRSITFDFNKRLSLFCSSANDNKSKYKTDFKKPFEVPSKVSIKRPESNLKNSRLNLKCSNGHLKNVSTVNEKQNLITQPNLNSDNNSRIKSATVASGSRPVSSRLSLPEKLPMKSVKTKGCELNTTVTFTTENNSNKVISCPKILDFPKKEKLSEIGRNNANTGKKISRHSIATNLPRKFPPFNNHNNILNSKAAVIKQKSAPESNSCKPDSKKVPTNSKLVSSITKLKFSSLPKVQTCTKTSSVENESKNAINKSVTSNSQKSNGHLKKPCVLEHKAVQFVKSQISTDYVKQKDNTREIAAPNFSMFPPSEQAAQLLNPLNGNKSNGQCNFRPMPKITKGSIRSMNSKDVHIVQQSDLQNQVSQHTAGKIPQMRRIPAPRYNN
ncbi:hypothetical protein HNY73_010366 [Argiope bruennichi]|uniref:Uncharacterized protein n=1 Tax=Argiope bruennichi TaxID=94029 RepID=A0A8T0F2N6_ARGBR|nr:hypothetical protein HNY73_010366 [Argiope bruennichi]